ncbi:MAG: PKD domain-containing protein [Sphingobacteriales bacterium]|nr:MAG: PKD domain-containing protein [Sphingobacteriales bacterium]
MKSLFLRAALALFLFLTGTTGSFAQLIANFTANVTSGCNPMVVQFTSTSTGNPVSYSWSFGNGNVSILQNPSATYTSSGTFTVTLTVTSSSGATNTKTMTGYIVVHDAPVVDFVSADTAGCPPHTASFTSVATLNAPGPGNYFWTFGTGTTVTSQNPTYTFITPGDYTVTHIVVNSAGCTTSVQKPAYVHVHTPPIAAFVATSTVLCGPDSAYFANQTTGSAPLSYAWDFGDGGTSTAANPVHFYASLGSYTVKLVVTDAKGCKDTLIKPAYVAVVGQNSSFTATTPVCAGGIVTLTNTTPFTIYANWDFGDNSAPDTNQTVNHQYLTLGNYTVSLAVNNGTCILYSTQVITVHPNPSISFTANTLTPCPAPATIQFTNNTVNGGTYTWFFGDGTSSTQTNPSHVYTANGFYDVTLVATNSHGCSDTLPVLEYVKIFGSSLGINVSPGDGCIPVTDSFSAVLSSFSPTVGGTIPYPAAITSYSWDFGDGSYSNLPGPVHVYPVAGSYLVKLVTVTANGCVDSAVVMVNTGTPPVPAFSANPIPACVDETIQFYNSSTNALTYEWHFGDGTVSTAANPDKSYTDPGTYTVMLIANNNGCMDSLIYTDYITINDPKAEFMATFQCDTLTKVNFVNLSTNYTSTLWDFGDGTFSTVPSTSHVYPAMGSYTVTLIVYNNVTGCTDTVFQSIDLISPQPAFTANDTAICPDTEITFNANFPGSIFISSYTWIFDGFTVPDTTAIINWPYYAPGYHDVSLVTEDIHGCQDTVIKNDYIIVGHPAVNFIANNTHVCVPGTVTFTNTSLLPAGTSVATSYWQFGNGTSTTVNGLTASSIYTALGTYDVELVVTDNIGCKDSLEKPAFINAHDPEAQFTVNTTNACVGAPLPFFSQSQGVNLSYLWSFGDGTTSTDPTPAHAYTQTGTYTVTLAVTDIYGCTDTLVKPAYITVWGSPTAAFTISDTFKICPPLFVQLTNNSTPNLVYNWDMGDGTSNFSVNPSHIYVNPGIFTIRLVAINNYGCRDTAYGQTHILGYDGVISYSPLTGCAPLTVSFLSNVNNVPGLVWDFSDGTTLATTAGVVTHTYTEPGARVPRLIMTDNAGCSSTSYGLDTIKVDGVYSGFTFDPYPACDKGTLQFLDTSKGAFSQITSRQWVFHSGFTSTAANPSQFYPGPGSYPVILYTSTSTGCRDTLLDTVSFYPLPVIDAGLDTIVCLGDAATLFPSGGISYIWSPAGSLSCDSCTNPQATPQSETMYYVLGIDTHGCAGTDSVRISLKTKTETIAGAGGEICRGESIRLSATGAHDYQWTPPTWLDDPGSHSPLATPEHTITYMVIASEGSCIPDSAYVHVVVHQLPDVEAGPDQTIIAGETAFIDASGTDVVTWEWSPAETLSCAGCEDPEANPKHSTTYSVIGYNQYGCQDSDKITIIVICDQSQVFMPNSFTPNGDGQNDYFYPRGKGIEIIKSFRVYNRWGELVFEQRGMNTNELNNGWDGTHKGQELPPDVFLYIVDAVCDTGEPVSWKGDISLIR